MGVLGGGQYLIVVMIGREGFLKEVGLKSGVTGEGRQSLGKASRLVDALCEVRRPRAAGESRALTRP